MRVSKEDCPQYRCSDELETSAPSHAKTSCHKQLSMQICPLERTRYGTYDAWLTSFRESRVMNWVSICMLMIMSYTSKLPSGSWWMTSWHYIRDMYRRATDGCFKDLHWEFGRRDKDFPSAQCHPPRQRSLKTLSVVTQGS